MCCWVISRSLEFTSSLELRVSVHIRSADGKVSSLYRGVEAHQDWGEQRGLEVVVGGCRWRARAGGRAVVIGRACGGRHRWSWMMLVVTALALSVLRLKAHRDLHVNEGPGNPKSMSDAGVCFKQKISHQTSTSLSINKIWWWDENTKRVSPAIRLQDACLHSTKLQ